jgi:hypothetical protein
MSLAWEIFDLLAGVFAGYAMSLFATPERAFVAFALCIAYIACRLSYYFLDGYSVPNAWMVSTLFAIATFVLVWLGLRWTLADQLPPLSYSLRLLPPEEAALFLRDSELKIGQGFYRFRIANLNPRIDVIDLHIALDLPARVVSAPEIIDYASSDTVRAKPAFSVKTENTPTGTRQIPSFSNTVILDIARIVVSAPSMSAS